MKSASDDEFNQVRREKDPLKQAKKATELLTVYQQRSTELARLRKDAINRAADETGMSFTAVAREVGISKGRLTQIRQHAPAVEREFFGVGPITVAVPLRVVEGRSLPVISSEDALASERLSELLRSLAFHVENYRIAPDGQWKPPLDAVAICGPKSSEVTARAISSDPVLSFEPGQDGRWKIQDRSSGRVFESPLDDQSSSSTDIAYMGRLGLDDERELFVIAGVHALGSVGAVDYLARNLSELYLQVGTRRFSMVVRSEHKGETVTKSEALCPPRIHIMRETEEQQ